MLEAIDEEDCETTLLSLVEEAEPEDNGKVGWLVGVEILLDELRPLELVPIEDWETLKVKANVE